MVATAVPKRPPVGRPVATSVRPAVWPTQYEEIMAAEITSTGAAVDSMPTPVSGLIDTARHVIKHVLKPLATSSNIV
jgi:hypothetical protein